MLLFYFHLIMTFWKRRAMFHNILSQIFIVKCFKSMFHNILSQIFIVKCFKYKQKINSLIPSGILYSFCIRVESNCNYHLYLEKREKGNLIRNQEKAYS